MRKWMCGPALVAAMGVSACAGTDFERGILGAGGGALVAQATGGNPVTGAVVGGAAGVVCDDVAPQVCSYR